MRYVVRETGRSYEDIDELLDDCITGDDVNWDRFEDYINERYGSIYIGGDIYYAYDILDNSGDLDDYRDSYEEDEIESLKDSVEYNLEHAGVGEEVDVGHYTVCLVDDDDDDTGDFDGDEDLFDEETDDVVDVIEQTRQFIQQAAAKEDLSRKVENEQQNNYCALFQTIGM